MSIAANRMYALRPKKVGVYDDSSGGYVVAALVDDIGGEFVNEWIEVPRHAAREMLAVLLFAVGSGAHIEAEIVARNQARRIFVVP